MKIILDTNIIYENYYLNTPRFLALFEFIKKTRSTIVIPSAVYSEVLKKYNEDLKKSVERTEKDNRVLFNKNEKVDIEKLSKDYEMFLFRYITSKKMLFPVIKQISTSKLFERSIKARPPFNTNDQGLRDTVIWLSIVDFIKKNKNDEFCFITANSLDFGKEKLFPELLEDLGGDATRLNYFNSIEDFIKEYGEKISFINEELLTKFMEKNDKHLLSLIDIERVSKSSFDNIPSDSTVLSKEIKNINFVYFDDFYIFHSDENYYSVQVDMQLDLEVGLELVSEHDGNDLEYNYDGGCMIPVEIALLVNKHTKEVKFDPQIPHHIYYS